ncbi:unnamed protein product [Effrenium voratum]|uniref:Uncharacterized protein n=1 Tax=Effrenium voratum TaxID=2562239 RepID=A0AA36NK22_9DINO|nr:unnamed protein product [Effrenium voratum]
MSATQAGQQEPNKLRSPVRQARLWLLVLALHASLGACLPRSLSPRLPARAKVARQAAEATPASITISKKMSELDERVKAVEKPEEEMFWRVLAYCTACRTPWCKLPWRRHTCLKGDAKAEGAQGNRCDMSWEDYTDILTRSVPLISHKKAQILTRECWREGDADPSGIGVVTVCIVPKVAAEEYGQQLCNNGVAPAVNEEACQCAELGAGAGHAQATEMHLQLPRGRQCTRYP